MKKLAYIALSFLLYMNVNAQKDSVTLLPDQNPNFQKSRTKYMEQSATLTQNEGQTIQQTYKAIDDVQAKKERKELAATRRQERRMARIQSRGYRRYGGYNNYNNSGYYGGYGNNGYNNYGYGNYGNNNYGYNNGYGNYNNYGYGNGYGNNYGYGYRPNFWGGPTFNTINSAVGTALLGLTLWHVLKH
ncbi:MAG: hypothetical protein V4506_06685 [Bacteroidota bacterium]